MSGEPLTREEREARMVRQDRHDAICAEQGWETTPWERRWEATVQAAERRAEIAENALERIADGRVWQGDVRKVASDALTDIRALAKRAPE